MRTNFPMHDVRLDRKLYRAIKHHLKEQIQVQNEMRLTGINSRMTIPNQIDFDALKWPVDKPIKYTISGVKSEQLNVWKPIWGRGEVERDIHPQEYQPWRYISWSIAIRMDDFCCYINLLIVCAKLLVKSSNDIIVEKRFYKQFSLWITKPRFFTGSLIIKAIRGAVNEIQTRVGCIQFQEVVVTPTNVGYIEFVEHDYQYSICATSPIGYQFYPEDGIYANTILIDTNCIVSFVLRWNTNA